MLQSASEDDTASDSDISQTSGDENNAKKTAEHSDNGRGATAVHDHRQNVTRRVKEVCKLYCDVMKFCFIVEISYLCVCVCILLPQIVGGVNVEN